MAGRLSGYLGMEGQSEMGSPARWLLPGLLSAIALLSVLSLMVGPVPIGPGALAQALAGGGDPLTKLVVWEIRLPRLLLALAVGAVLAVAGAALQGLLRNPLAEPSILGISNAAALGAVVALYFGLAAAFPLALPLLAVTFSFFAVAALRALAGRAAGPLTLILAGIALGSLAGAAVSLALNLSPNPFAAIEISYWLLGSLEDRSLRHVALALPLIAVGLILLFWDRRAMDALTLGEEAAQSLGFDLERVRLRIVIGVALGVGAAVAVSGTIGFVGLIVPHLMRPLVQHEPARLYLPSALAGAVLLVGADIAVRVLPTANQLQLGVVTSFLGIPFFLFLLLRARRGS